MVSAILLDALLALYSVLASAREVNACSHAAHEPSRWLQALVFRTDLSADARKTKSAAAHLDGVQTKAGGIYAILSSRNAQLHREGINRSRHESWLWPKGIRDRLCVYCT